MAGAPAPSACSTRSPIRPPFPFAGPTTVAPAPSAKRAAVPRSAGSVKRLSTSAPITRAWSERPASTWAVARERADRKPVQAAPTSIVPARRAPSSCATSGAAFGLTSSAATVATSTRSRSTASTPASVSARRPAAVARSLRRSPSRTKRRSRTPVRCTIHCSVTPAPSAITSLPTTRSGTALATDARAAARRRRPSQDGGVAVATAPWWYEAASGAAILALVSCIGGLHCQRCVRLHAVERLADEVCEYAAGAGLDEAGHTALLESAHDLEPAHRVGDGLHEALADVVERLRGDARQDRHARLAHLRLHDQGAEWLHDGLHQGRVECARHGKTLGAHAGLPQPFLRGLEVDVRSGQDELVGSVVVGHGQAALAGDGFDRPALPRTHGDHAAVGAPLGRLLHEATAGGHQPESVLGGERVRGRQRRDLPERVAGHEVRLNSIAEHVEARQRGAEDRGLGPPGPVRHALEEVVADLGAGELEQVGAMTLHLLAHVGILAALPREQQRDVSVSGHPLTYAKGRGAVSQVAPRTPRSGGLAGTDGGPRGDVRRSAPGARRAAPPPHDCAPSAFGTARSCVPSRCAARGRDARRSPCWWRPRPSA